MLDEVAAGKPELRAAFKAKSVRAAGACCVALPC